MRQNFPLLLAAGLFLTACNPASPDSAALGPSTDVGANAASGDRPSPDDDIALADRPPPQPLNGGKPLAGEWDPAIMTVELAGDRLTVHDAKRHWSLQLDRSDYDVVRRAMAMFGTPVFSRSVAECPAGQLDFLDYANGLQLAFQNGKLAGYWVKEGSRGVTAGNGIAPGSPRKALGNAPYRAESFGKLVTVNGTIAILADDESKITDLYAGAACIFD